MAYQIFRPLSEEEKFNLTELNKRRNIDLLDIFLADLAKKQQEYQKKKIPFDTFGARIDFESKMKNKIDEMQASSDLSKFNPDVEFNGFEDYAKPERFEYIEKTEDKIVRLVVGVKQEVHSGWRYHFKTKDRGNKLSIFVDDDEEPEMEKWIAKHYGKKEDTSKKTKDKESKE